MLSNRGEQTNTPSASVHGWGCVCSTAPRAQLCPHRHPRGPSTFFIACTCTTVTFLQGYGVVNSFSPEGSGYFQGREGMCVFLHTPHFTLVNCPTLCGYGRHGRAAVGVPDSAGGSRLRCQKGTPSTRAPGVSGALHCPGEGGAGHSTDPPASHSQAGGRKPTLQQCRQSQSDPSK